MRIVGGRFKGHKLSAPAGDATRPTADAQRESLFNILINGMAHEPKRVLDLFAGTGALSIEALSHGAERAVLVERDSKALTAIKRNFEKLPLEGSTYVLVTEPDMRLWMSSLKRTHVEYRPFDLVFCDPPYGKGLVDRVIKALEPIAIELFAEGALLACELSTRDEEPKLPPAWVLVKDRARGTTRFMIYERAAFTSS